MKPVPASAEPAAPRQRFWTVLACVVIVAAGIAVYSNSFNVPLIFDDELSIQGNPTIRHFPDWRNLAPPRASPFLRRPVVNLTFALNYAMGWPDVSGFHVVNLLIHLLAALTLFGVVRRTLWTAWTKGGRKTKGPRAVAHDPSATSSIVALIIALLWAIHPLLTESVTYLTQRTESLMGMFYLLTLYGAIRGASSAHPWRWYSLSIAACALGMGSKEVMTTAPVIVLLYDRCFMSGSFREALRQRRTFYLGLAATWVIFIALLIAYPWGASAGQGFGISAMTPWQYARTQAGIVLHYFRLSFWPRGLTLDYAWPIAKGFQQVVPACAVIVVLLAGTVWALRRRPALGFLGAWIFLILAPSSSFVPIPAEVAAERRMYLPLAAIVAGCVLAACWIIERLSARKFPARAAAVLVGLSVAIALGGLTLDRNHDYRSAISIWKDTVRKAPHGIRAANALGWAYHRAGEDDLAFDCFDKAIEMDVSDADRAEVCYSRGCAWAALNRIPEAIQDFTRAVELNPGHANAFRNRAILYVQTRDYQKALDDYAEAIRLVPGYAEAYKDRGSEYAQLRQFDFAECDYSKAIELSPDDAEAYAGRAAALIYLGRFEPAVRDCDRAIALKPDCLNAYLNRAAAYEQLGQLEKALQDVRWFERLSGQPQTEAINALLRAMGRTE